MRAIVVRPGVVWGDPIVPGAFADRRAVPRITPAFLSAPLGAYCVNTVDPVVALTYDDGPHPTDTARILDVLAERGRVATFYVLARQVARFPDVARRIVADGHELALHGDDHDSLLTMSTRTAVRRIRDAKRSVEDTVGVKITTYRPPYGEVTLAQAIGIRALGLQTIIWTGDAVDWIHDDEAPIAERALAGVFPGAIILLHDDRADPERLEAGQRLPAFDRADVLRRITDGLDASGFATVTVRDLIRSYPPVRSHVRY